MTTKSHSWWWDSHNPTKNSKWLAENLEKMDNRVNHMLKLIEEDSDSFAKKAQMYYQKRPELIHLVKEFCGMYHALAERYNQASGELQMNQSSKIQSQSSLDQSSALEDSDSRLLKDRSSDEDGGEALVHMIDELELELQETKKKLILHEETVNGDNNLVKKIIVYKRELGEANEKIRTYEEEIVKLKSELQSCCMSSEIEEESKKVQALEEELSIIKHKLQSFEEETCSLKNELEISKQKLLLHEKTANADNNLLQKITLYEGKLRETNEKIQMHEEEIVKLKSELESCCMSSRIEEDTTKVQALEEELSITKHKLHGFEEETCSLKNELETSKQKLLLHEETANANNNLLQKITLYEGKLREANEKIQMHEEEIDKLKNELQSCCMSSGTEEEATKVQALEEELSITKHKLQDFKEETCSLKNELEMSKPAEEMLQRLEKELELARKDAYSYRNKLNAEKKEVVELQERLSMVKTSLLERDNEITTLKTMVSDAEEMILFEKSHIKGEMSKLVEERKTLREQLRELESLIRLISEEKAEMEEKLKGEFEKIRVMRDESDVLREETNEIEMSKAAQEKLENLEKELDLARKDVNIYRNKLNAEKKEVVKLQERLAMMKTSLHDRDNEIKTLKMVVSDVEEKIFPKKAEIKGEMSKLVEEPNHHGEQLRKLESCIRLVSEEKAEMEEKLRRESEKIRVMRDESDVLREEIEKREEKRKENEKHMEELHMEHVRMKRRSEELEEEVRGRRVAASKMAEQKREAIRQLCMSLEHYRDGYDKLWKVVIAGLDIREE